MHRKSKRDNSIITPEQLIDLSWYSKQAGIDFKNVQDAYTHFKTEGQHRFLDPSPFFYTQWYLWHYCHNMGHRDILEHFLYESSNGAFLNPAPFVDCKSLILAKQYKNPSQALAALTDGSDTSLSPSLEVHLAQLRKRQKEFHQSVHSHYVRRESEKRPRLVWVQAGARFSTDAWFKPDTSRSWDLMCNWYQTNGLDLRHGEIHLIQAGTKSSGIYHVLCNDPGLFQQYEQILFLDDDLLIRHEEIDLLFDLAASAGLDIFQPSLLPASYGSWPSLFRKTAHDIRLTKGVEIMMPGFTRDALFACIDILGRSISGYGLDYLFSEHIRNKGGICGIIDEIGVLHDSAINVTEGSFYDQMRKWNINYNLELYAAIHKIGRYPTFEDIITN